jgi:hypothetical protein
MNGVLAVFLLLVFLAPSAEAERHLTLLITSNLKGDFCLDIHHQETADPLLRLGQNIVAERREAGIDCYLDLGNALYPGTLAKYSAGSIMMDFLDDFGCDALLVSSKDLQIGTLNLQFLGKNKKVHLLSSNIEQAGKPIFTPWFAVDREGTRIAFLGISSHKVRFDMAAQELYDYNLVEAKKALAAPLKAIRAAGIPYIILLSGQRLKGTADILDTYPEIGMAISGGDATGRFFSSNASRLDLADGRSIIIVDGHMDYYLVNLILDGTIKVQALKGKHARPIPTQDFAYQQFKNRLTLWKQKFAQDEAGLVANLGRTTTPVDDLRFAQLLRDRFNCELGMVEEGTIYPSSVNQNLKYSDLLSMVNRDYSIFVFSLTGKELSTVHKDRTELVIAGLGHEDGISIQGYPLMSNRRYRVAATQVALQVIQRLLHKKITYRNTWLTVTEVLRDDLKHKQIILSNNFDFLDRKFRTTIDASLSNFMDDSSVKRSDGIDTPPGQPSESYNKWGLENSINITLYNKYHRFVFTPYMLYSRQDNDYLNNILRGTFLYDYNLSGAIKPYNKFRCDTVVEAVNGQRPIILRETLGASTEHKRYDWKLGLGLEKQLQDPAEDTLYGVELIFNAHVPFLDRFMYTFNLDTFSGVRGGRGNQWQIRSEINNVISATINAHLSLSFRHKFFYYKEDGTGATYQNSEFITSLDLKHNWKFW